MSHTRTSEIKSESKTISTLPTTTLDLTGDESQPEFCHTYEEWFNKSKPRIDSDKVEHIEPDYKSFDEIKATEHRPWIKEADTKGSFYDYLACISQLETKHEAKVNNKNRGKDDKVIYPNYIREPNANTLEELTYVINSSSGNPASNNGNIVAKGLTTISIVHPLAKTKYIKPGEIHFIDFFGKQEIRVNPGLNYLGAGYSWRRKDRIEKIFLQEKNVKIILVPQGKIAIAMENQTPIILLPGRHAFNDPLVQFSEKDLYDINQDEIQKGMLSIIRIRPNEVGLGRLNNQNILMLPGLHVENTAAFEYDGKINTRTLQLASNPHRKDQIAENTREEKSRNEFIHGTISIVLVESNMHGCALMNQFPVLLKPGVHVKNKQAFRFKGFVERNIEHVQFGTIHVIQVPDGQIGLAMDNNKAIVLRAGTYEVNSPTFKFIKMANLSDDLIQHGPITIVRVNQSNVGYAWYKGKTIELPPGLHIFVTMDNSFLNNGKSLIRK